MQFEDMIQWSLPLAAEQIDSKNVWDRFRDITLENQSKLTFAQNVNLAWSFNKVHYKDNQLANIIENSFLKEIQTSEKEPEA
jgi:hypothetical protein